MGAGVDDVDDVESADGFLRCDLRGIDGGRRFVDIDDLVDFLQVRDGNIDGRAGPDLNAGLIESVEAWFLDAELVLAFAERGELATSCEVGLAVDGGRGRRGLQGDAGGGDDNTVFVGDDDGRRIRLGNGARDQSEGEEQGAHAVTGILTLGCGEGRVGFEVPFRGPRCKIPTLRQAQGRLSGAKDAREMGHPAS